MRSYNKTQVSLFDPTKLAIHYILRPEDDHISNCGQNFKKTVSFDDIVHFIDKEDIVIYDNFDCGVTFYPETPTKIKQMNRERNYISRSCEKSKCVPSNDRHNCFIDEQHNSNIFLNPYNLWDMAPAALISLNHTNDRYSMSNQYPQPTTHQPRTELISGVLFLAKDGHSKEGIARRLCILSTKLPTRRTSERNSCYC